MIEIHELNHVALHVADVVRSVAFYRDSLGLKQIPRPDFDFPGAWFALGPSQELHLIGDRQERVPSGHRAGHFALRVRSIKEVESYLHAQGIPMHGPKQRPDGVWQIFIKDPDGHAVEFSELG